MGWLGLWSNCQALASTALGKRFSNLYIVVAGHPGMSWWFLAGFYISTHLFTEAHSITSSLTLLSKLIRLKLAWQASAGCTHTFQLQCNCSTYIPKNGLWQEHMMGSNLKGRNHIPGTLQGTPKFLLQRLPETSKYNIFYCMQTQTQPHQQSSRHCWRWCPSVDILPYCFPASFRQELLL